MDKPESTTTARLPAETSPSTTPEPLPLHATSQGFYPPSAPNILRRSLILSSVASALGAMFFAVVQGTIFNFFLEDLSLRDRLPYFMALWMVAGLGTLVGSWIQQRWNCRKQLFLWGVGGSRVLWLAIGLIPLLWPHLAHAGPAFYWLTALTLLFYFIHALGSNAWLSWMADLVPPHLQGKYWSLRQVGCSGASAFSRIAFGYYLDAHHNFTGYATIFIIAAIIGIVDALLFIWVEHRHPKRRAVPLNVTGEFIRRMREEPFRRLCMVYLLWGISNCIMGPTCYYFMRDQVGMDIKGISLIETLSILSFTVFSLVWGKFSDRHGHRGPLMLCILLHACGPISYFFAGRGDEWLVGIAMVVGSIGFCGINLFMFPMLINFTRDKSGGREIAMATFSVVLGVSNFIAFIVTDQVLYTSLGIYLDHPSHSTPVYLAAMAIAMFMRFASASIVTLLPRTEKETAPGVLITEVVSTSPLRAALGFYRYVTGQEELEDVKAEPPVLAASSSATAPAVSGPPPAKPAACATK